MVLQKTNLVRLRLLSSPKAERKLKIEEPELTNNWHLLFRRNIGNP